MKHFCFDLIGGKLKFVNLLLVAFLLSSWIPVKINAQVLFKEDLEKLRESIPEGYKEISIPVERETVCSGFKWGGYIVPGVKVDLLLVSGSGLDAPTRTIQDAKIISVNGSISSRPVDNKEVCKSSSQLKVRFLQERCIMLCRQRRPDWGRI